MKVNATYLQNDPQRPIQYGEAQISNPPRRRLRGEAVKEGILREGAAHFDVAWDYFSEKDGEVHHFDLCEECYDGVTREFLIEADKEERTELL